MLSDSKRINLSALILIGFLNLVINVSPCLSQERKLSLDEFIRIATINDTNFEEILIDELVLKYQKDLRLPARDIVLAVKQEHELLLSKSGDSPTTTASLSKLFPMQGTTVSLGYEVNGFSGSDSRASEVNFSVAQSVAENAFGKATRLRDKIIGLEIDVAKHQITEAYEDYFALLSSAYISWNEAFENLIIGRNSYNENQKLLKDIKAREKKQIALPIDVNKITLQVQEKEETLIRLEESYQATLNVIQQSLRNTLNGKIRPLATSKYDSSISNYSKDFHYFRENGRTYKVLNMLEKRSSLQVEKEADDLLPSVDLVLGYRVRGQEYSLQKEEHIGFFGFKFEFPFDDQVQGAEYQISKITRDKQFITTKNVDFKLRQITKTLYGQIEREQKLLKIANAKIKLAKAVLKDEAENYSFGKVTLNDYIRAVNALDSNRFNKVAREAQLRKLIVEWLRITDQLVVSR